MKSSNINNSKSFVSQPIISFLSICLIVVSLAFSIKASEKVQIAYEWNVLPLQRVDIPITFESETPIREMAGFDLLLEIEMDHLEILEIRPGQLFDDCAWELFNYTIDTSTGLVRIVGQADIDDGNVPDCFTGATNELAVITARIELATGLEFQFNPFRWYWSDCFDNTFIDLIGDTIFLSNKVYSFDIWSEITADNPFPSFTGASSICDSTLLSVNFQRSVDFVGGAIEMLRQDIIDETGDVNINGIANEIADWVLFSNYFIYGLSAFVYNEYLQTNASDVNRDGITLTLDDLVYLNQLVNGNVLPSEEDITINSNDTVFFVQDTLNKTVRFDYDSTITALHFIFDGEITPVDTSIYSPGYHYDSTYTRVLYFPLVSGFELLPFDSSFLFEYSGDGTLIGASAAVDGELIVNSNIPISDVYIFTCCDRRGNIDGLGIEGSKIDIRDLIFLVNYIYGIPENSEPQCFDAANVDGIAGLVNVFDLIYLIYYMFKDGPAPPDCP